jgi:D-sedoheptulose 7-phosphate isomerase
MTIEQSIQTAITVQESILSSTVLTETICEVYQLITAVFQRGGKILLCGNGGSAGDAQHLAAEFTGRFYKNRRPLYAEALHCNTSYLTAVANDFSYEDIYARLLEAEGTQGDVLIAFSTSGNSMNVIKAVEQANAQKMFTVGFTGLSGGALKSICQYLINVPSSDTPRIQEAHLLIGHIICEQVEAALF